MNTTHIIFIISIILAPTITYSMLCPLIKTKAFQKVITQRCYTTKNSSCVSIEKSYQPPTKQTSYFSSIAPELRQLIYLPNFTRRQASDIIKKKMRKIAKTEDVHELITDVIDKAIQHKPYEKKYAHVLDELYTHGWSCNGWGRNFCCYTAGLAHKAARNDLLCIMKVLLKQNKEFTTTIQDSSGRISLHYAQSEAMADLLIKNGADIKAKDFSAQTSLHTVPYAATKLLLSLDPNLQALANNKFASRSLYFSSLISVLNAAAYSGDQNKVNLLLQTIKFPTEEEKTALSILSEVLNKNSKQNTQE